MIVDILFNRARQTLPSNYSVVWQDTHRRVEVISKSVISPKTKLGTLTAKQEQIAATNAFQLGVGYAVAIF